MALEIRAWGLAWTPIHISTLSPYNLQFHNEQGKRFGKLNELISKQIFNSSLQLQFIQINGQVKLETTETITRYP